MWNQQCLAPVKTCTVADIILIFVWTERSVVATKTETAPLLWPQKNSTLAMDGFGERLTDKVRKYPHLEDPSWREGAQKPSNSWGEMAFVAPLLFFALVYWETTDHNLFLPHLF